MQVSISFDPINDNADDIHDAVDHLFTIGDMLASTGTNNVPVIPASAPVGTPAAPQAHQAPAAPTAPTAPAAPATTGVDSTGLPWDERIHSKPAKTNSDGTWRGRRGVDKQLVAQVEAQLRGGAAPQASAAPTTLAPLAPVAPPAPPVPPSAYEMLVRLVAENSYHTTSNPTGRITEEWLQASLAQSGVPGGLIQNAASMDPARVQAIYEAIRTALGL